MATLSRKSAMSASGARRVTSFRKSALADHFVQMAKFLSSGG